MKKKGNRKLFLITTLLAAFFVQGCGGNAIQTSKEIESQQMDTSSKKKEKQLISKEGEEILSSIHTKYLNLIETYEPIFYHSENNIIPGQPMLSKEIEFIYDKKGNAKSIENFNEYYLFEDIGYARVTEKSPLSDAFMVLSDDLIESEDATQFFFLRVGMIKEGSKVVLEDYLNIDEATEVDINGTIDDQEITLKSPVFKNEKRNEAYSNGQVTLEKMIITDKNNELTIQLVTSRFTYQLHLIPNYQEEVERPKLYERGETVEINSTKPGEENGH